MRLMRLDPPFVGRAVTRAVVGPWADLASPAFRELSASTICVLPLGATGQHGPHLPVSVDSDLAGALLDMALGRLAAGVSVLVLPLLAITCSSGHARFPGTLALRPTTLLAMLADIAEGVAASGMERLVRFNGHGGNRALLEVAVREMRIRHNLIVTTASWFDFANTDGLFDAAALKMDIHAGESETAAMLALCPNRVDMSKAADFVPAMLGWAGATGKIGLTGQPARPAWVIEDLNPHGVCGNAAAAQADSGSALLQSAADGFAAFLLDFAAFDHRSGAPR